MPDIDEMADRAVAAPGRPAPDMARVRTRVAQRRRRRWTVIAVVALLPVVSVGAWLAGRDPGGTAVSTGGSSESAPSTVSVVHETVAYEQSYELDDVGCRSGEVTGEFDEMVFESWGSEDLGRWRQTVTYADGRTRDLVLAGSPWYPSEVWEGGEMLGTLVRCPGYGIVLAEPGQGSPFWLNPLAVVPEVDGRSVVPSYAEIGELVSTDGSGPGRQVVEVWRQVVEGFTDVNGEQRAISETREWLVDPEAGRVVQQSFDVVIEAVGSASWRAVLVERSDTTLDSTVFDTSGLEQAVRPGEDAPPEGTIDTTTSMAQVGATFACPEDHVGSWHPGDDESDFEETVYLNGLREYSYAPHNDGILDLAELGEVVATVCFTLNQMVFDADFAIQDGDATYLPIGTELRAIRGSDPRLRLAAVVEAGHEFYEPGVQVYEVDQVDDARVGREVIDLAEIVEIRINSDFDGVTQLGSIDDVDLIEQLVAAVNAAPIGRSNGRETGGATVLHRVRSRGRDLDPTPVPGRHRRARARHPTPRPLGD